MCKILFTDLDATLLCDDKTVSEKNRQMIHKMLEQGNYFVLATGRSVESGRAVVKELGLRVPGCYMIAFNGAVVYDCAADHILLKRSVSEDVVHEIFERAEKAGIYAQTYNTTDIITTRHSKELDYYRKRARMSYKIVPNILDALQEEPQKVLLIDLERDGKLEAFQKENAAWAKGKCNCFFSCREYLEYCPVGTDKGTGAEYLMELLDVPMKDSFAVGDEQNDISMLKKVHTGVAMKNGTPEIKQAADYITENDNNHDAIAEIIEKFIL